MTMKQIKNIFCAGALLVSLLTFQGATAQVKDKVNNAASFELMNARSVWFNSENGAGIYLDKLNDFTKINLNYDVKNGTYKLNQSGKNESSLGITTEGGQKLNNGYAWGKFSFNNDFLKGTRFNTQMLDPSRGVPYYVADPNLSDWKKQYYKLEMSLASKPLWNFLHAGIKAEYVSKSGAKQVDPRSVVYYYHINVKPGLVATFGNHSVGLNAVYQNLSQTSSTTNSDSEVNQNVYVLKGLGNNYIATVGGLQSLGMFLYKGNTLGGALQYSYIFPLAKIFFEGTYDYKVEDVISAPTKPKKEGTVSERVIGANVALVVEEGSDFGRLNLSFKDSKTNGIEYVQVLDNTYEVQRWVDIYSSIRSTYNYREMAANFDFFRKSVTDYKWRAGVNTKYTSNDDLYIMPESKMKIENMYVGGNIRFNMPLGKSTALLIGAELTYKYNYNGKYSYNGAEPQSVIITEFMTPDFAFMKTSYKRLGGNIALETKLGRTRMSLNANILYYDPMNLEKSRVHSQLGLGFNF